MGNVQKFLRESTLLCSSLVLSLTSLSRSVKFFLALCKHKGKAAQQILSVMAFLSKSTHTSLFHTYKIGQHMLTSSSSSTSDLASSSRSSRSCRKREIECEVTHIRFLSTLDTAALQPKMTNNMGVVIFTDQIINLVKMAVTFITFLTVVALELSSVERRTRGTVLEGNTMAFLCALYN